MSSIGRWFLKRCHIKESIVVLQTNMDHCGSCGDLTEYKKLVSTYSKNLKGAPRTGYTYYWDYAWRRLK